MTAFSFLALPAVLVCCFRPAWLLQLAMVFSIFEAAAAVAVGGFGLQPALVPAAVFVPYVTLQLLLGVRYFGRHDVWWTVLPFVLVTAWAVAGSWLLPHLFAGAVDVWPQKLEPPFVAVPLEPTSSNLNQVLYIVIACSVLVTSALFFSGSLLSADRLMNAYLLSGFMAAGIGFWQLANRLGGIPYPESFFFSNPGWSILSEQSVGLAPRINGTFSEPSSFAGYLAGIICCTGWLTLRGHRDRILLILFAVSLLALICSTSTTGYGVLAVMAVGLPVYAVATGSWHLITRMVVAAGLLAIVLGCSYLAISAYAPETGRVIDEVVIGTMNKQESSSYQDRTSADADSIALLLPTYGFGVGWGSNRSSSLIPGTLANLGVYGFVGVIWFGVRLVALASRAGRAATDPKDRRVIDGASGALVGQLVACMLSGPTITSVGFYLLAGVLIGTSARTLSAAELRRRQPLLFAQRPAGHPVW